MKRLIQSFLAIFLIAGMLFAGTGCEQLGLSKKEDNNGLMLLLGLAALQNGGASSSGFFVTIPAGVAK